MKILNAFLTSLLLASSVLVAPMAVSTLSAAEPKVTTSSGDEIAYHRGYYRGYHRPYGFYSRGYGYGYGYPVVYRSYGYGYYGDPYYPYGYGYYPYRSSGVVFRIGF